jgi:hypothetical protein
MKKARDTVNFLLNGGVRAVYRAASWKGNEHEDFEEAKRFRSGSEDHQGAEWDISFLPGAERRLSYVSGSSCKGRRA